jgi:hypothetical protein
MFLLSLASGDDGGSGLLKASLDDYWEPQEVPVQVMTWE